MISSVTCLTHRVAVVGDVTLRFAVERSVVELSNARRHDVSQLLVELSARGPHQEIAASATPARVDDIADTWTATKTSKSIVTLGNINSHLDLTGRTPDSRERRGRGRGRP